MFLQDYPNTNKFELGKYFKPSNVIEGIMLPISFKVAVQNISHNSNLISLNGIFIQSSLEFK
jgi:hypothetical protein